MPTTPEVRTVATSAQISLDGHRDRCPKDVHFHETPGGELLATRVDEDLHPKIYRVTGQTRNPRALVSADAVVVEGRLLEAYANGRTVRTQHPRAGRAERYDAEEWLDKPALTLDRLDRPERGGTA